MKGKVRLKCVRQEVFELPRRNGQKNRKLFKSRELFLPIMQTITMPKAELEQLHKELETLRNSGLYKRLLEFEKNISEGKRFTRADLGF